ncbi:drug resistance transporter, EmrB/QacA subfamily [Pseudofrankia inefficax]|uniref:Drug resistance transporter, EmrB/QacA subfamily n=1 Tax=Pseudofrankia inefficax (strain DSM 45817 / CECT 9037 / DDB 130130 / EuI1c) TaxID=298654 RepID=E3JD95_PSEI1|nr:drug resistance transporter, EmrB/QacA subfamily [Pseudofrankia inefficax]
MAGAGGRAGTAGELTVGPGRPRRPRAVRRTGLLLTVALAAFVTALDNTVVNVALPSIERDLTLSTTGLEWVATAYILTFSSLLLAGGRLADLFGRRRVLLLGLVIFAVGSVLCGHASSGTELIAARAAQGAGGAAVLPATLAILTADLDGRDRDLGAGVLTAAIAAALALGPAVGGAISQYAHWSWVFYVNVPVCAVTMALACWAVPPSRRQGGRRASLDILGLATSGLALLALTWALVESNDRGFTSPSIIYAFALAGVAGWAFVAVETTGTDPMLDLALFRSPAFSGGTAAQMLWGLGVNGVFLFTSLYLQSILGFSPVGAGLAFVPLAVALVLAVPATGRLVAACGARFTVAAGLGAVAAGLYLTAQVGPGASYLDLLPGLLIIGAGSALTTPLTSVLLGDVDPAGAGMASAVLSTAREVSGVLGVSVTGAILLARQRAVVAAGGSAVDGFVAGYSRGLKVSAGLVALGALISLATLGPAGRARRAPGRHRRPRPHPASSRPHPASSRPRPASSGRRPASSGPGPARSGPRQAT